MSDETEIRTLIENWARAVRDADLAGILAHHADDIVMFDVPPPVQSRGMDAYKSTWDLFFRYSPGGEGSFDLSELEITASDTVAFCHALINVAGNPARLTIGLHKPDNQWLVTHEHHSYPLDPPD